MYIQACQYKHEMQRQITNSNKYAFNTFHPARTERPLGLLYVNSYRFSLPDFYASRVNRGKRNVKVWRLSVRLFVSSAYSQ